MEQTLLIVKPQGVARGLVGEILTRFEKRGFKICAVKFVNATPELLAQHYAEHYGRDYYPKIEAGMMTGPIFVFVIEGPTDTVNVCRQMLGATDPLKSAPGTIRGDFALNKGCNVLHASDSIESANREINIWFKPEEVLDYEAANFKQIYRSD